MGASGKIIDALTAAVKLNQTVSGLIADMKMLNHELRKLEDRWRDDARDKERRLVRLETYLEIAQNQRQRELAISKD